MAGQGGPTWVFQKLPCDAISSNIWNRIPSNFVPYPWACILLKEANVNNTSPRIQAMSLGTRICPLKK